MTAGVASKNQARDLEADLAICEAATDGLDLEEEDGSIVFTHFLVADGDPNVAGFKKHEDAVFFAEARTGWPYAIRRAMEAENEVDKLRRELENLQDQMNRPRGCWD